jgi:hypothetical protein
VGGVELEGVCILHGSSLTVSLVGGRLSRAGWSRLFTKHGTAAPEMHGRTHVGYTRVTCCKKVLLGQEQEGVLAAVCQPLMRPPSCACSHPSMLLVVAAGTKRHQYSWA